MQTEYIRSLNSNYERILLDKKPEEQKYQYCIISRGGIKNLLPCSLRYINGLAYLYYDITSKQSVEQLCARRPINRKWVREFFGSVKEMHQELSRFLLDGQNILYYPQQIYRDLESGMFFFLFVPYYEGENGFCQLLEYFVEHIDYEDEGLVECIYKIYEQYEEAGETYLQRQLYEDVKMLDEEIMHNDTIYKEKGEAEEQIALSDMAGDSVVKKDKKGFLSIFEGKKRKDKEERDNYRQLMQAAMNDYAVAEEISYEEEWGKTIYMETMDEQEEPVLRLCTPEGKMVICLDKPSLIIGKKRDEVDLVLDEVSVSRIHARITKEQKGVYLEDLNSTNGTFKNGLRLQPYEKRKLEQGDEIRFGKKVLIYC